MVLEAFLLIHIGGSSTFYNTESNNSCLFKYFIQSNRIECIFKNFAQEEKNRNENIHISGDLINEPDSIQKSDSIDLEGKSSVVFDSIHAGGAFPKLIYRAKPEHKNGFEIPTTDNLSEPVKPEFALTSEQIYTGNFYDYFSKNPEIRKLNAESITLKQDKSIDFKYLPFPSLKLKPQRDWFSIILISSILLLAWIRSFFGRYFQQSLQSLYDLTLSNKLFRNKNVLLPRISFLLLFNFIIISSLFTIKSLEIINIPIFKTSFSSFIFLNIIFLMVIILRFISFHGLNILFPRNPFILEYHYQVQNFYKSIGLIILPILIFETYLPTVQSKLYVWAGLIVVAILYGYRLLRGHRIINRKNFPLNYVFLYVITFEILPISICFKIFSEII